MPEMKDRTNTISVMRCIDRFTIVGHARYDKESFSWECEVSDHSYGVHLTTRSDDGMEGLALLIDTIIRERLS